MGDSIYRKVMIRYNLQETDDACFTDSLPGQTLNQRTELLIAERQLRGAPGFSPVKLAAVEPAGTQPDAKTIVDQHLHPVGAFVSEKIRTMRPGTAKHLHHPGQRRVRPGAHIQRLGGQPDLIDADHYRSSRSSARQRSVCDTGQLMLMLCWRYGISTRIASVSAARFTGGAGCTGALAFIGKATKPGAL